MVHVNSKTDDFVNNSEFKVQDGKVLITRPDGHIVVDEKGGIRILS
jgi:hypothetical protein